MCLPQRLLGASFVELHSTHDQRAIESAFAAAKSGLTPETFGAQCRKADASHVRLSWSIQWSPHYGQMFCVGRAA
jgi:hypothetical protein